MEKFYKIIDEKIKEKYEEIENNKKKLDETIKETCNKFGIEAKEYYLTTQVLKMEFTKNDRAKFKNKISKTGRFKLNSDVHKFFIQRTRNIGRIEGLTIFDFGMFVWGRVRQKIFKWENELYFYINTVDYDYKDEVKGTEEINLSRYYEILSKIQKKKESEA